MAVINFLAGKENIGNEVFEKKLNCSVVIF